MGQHKRNPVAIAAKNGELPPKKPKKSKAQVERSLYAMMQERLYNSIALPPSLLREEFLRNGKIY